MRLVDAAEPTFARHETFHPRYGWFRKAYAFAAIDRRIFSADDAPVRMGVGKNMVRAIRFWGRAAKLVTVDPDSPRRRVPEFVPTGIGHGLFSADGWDPFMEDPGTLWLLHWLLLAPPSLVPVWWVMFNQLHAVEFDDDSLEGAIHTHLEAAAQWPLPLASSVRKDISAFIRTYAPTTRTGRSSLDDVLDCPLRELGLVTRSVATSKLRFVIGPKPTLPDEIVGYAVFDYLARQAPAASTVTLARLASEPGGPGRAFKLLDSDLHAALTAVSETSSDIHLLAPTGTQQLSWSGDPGEIAVDLLNRYYDVQVGDLLAGPPGDQAVATGMLSGRGDAHGRQHNPAMASAETGAP